MGLPTLVSILSGLQGIRAIPNALSLPVVILRETLPEDGVYLQAAADSSHFRSINFPEGLSELERKIAVSQRSFSGEITTPESQEFMFTVLSSHQTGAIAVGSSTFYPKHGTEEAPHNAYRLNGNHEDPLLTLITDWDGPAEVGAIVVHAALQGARELHEPVDILVKDAPHRIHYTGGYGRAASWVRFLWAAMPHHRKAFEDRSCLAEMLPPLYDDAHAGRTNAFYETAIKPHVDHRPYGQLDLETLADRLLIGRRLPAQIRVADLPEEARAVIGQVGPKSQPALKLLKRLGFQDTSCVDPLDAGPHYAGRFAENPLFTGARNYLFAGANQNESEIGWTYGMLGVHRPERGVRFRAALAPFFVVEDNLWTTPVVAEGLFLNAIGTPVTAAVAPL